MASSVNAHTALWTVPTDTCNGAAGESSPKTLDLQRPSNTADAAAWVRLDLQYSTQINQVKVEFGTGTTWDALKHYEIQVGSEDRIDSNPTYAQYTVGDEDNNSSSTCADCVPLLSGVDADILLWLRFDHPTFIGKDSSNYMRHASIMTAPRNGADELALYDVPTTMPLNSTHGPAYGSLLLENFYFMQIAPLWVRPGSDFTLSFWFVGMPHPAARENTILELSTPDARNLIRIEQSHRNAPGVTTFFTNNNKPAIGRSSSTQLWWMIFSRNAVTGCTLGNGIITYSASALPKNMPRCASTGAVWRCETAKRPRTAKSITSAGSALRCLGWNFPRI